MTSPQDLAVDGDSLYVASSGTPGGVTAFTIGADGSLDQANSGAECVQQSNSDNCTVGRGLQGASSIAVRGTKIYVGTAAGRLSTVNRDPGTGLMQGATTAPACLSGAALSGCTTVAELAAGVGDVAVGADGEVYASVAQATTPEGVVTQSGRVLTFNPSGEGLARRAGATGCVSNGASANCTTGRGLATSVNSHLITTPDGARRLRDRLGDRRARPAAARSRRAATPAAASRRRRWRAARRTSAPGSPTGVGDRAGRPPRLHRLRRARSRPCAATRAARSAANTAVDGPARLPGPDRDPVLRPRRGPADVHDDHAADARLARRVRPRGGDASSTPRRRARTGRRRWSFRATYSSFGTFVGDGSVQVNVVGAPVVLPARDRRRPGRVHGRPGLPRRQPEHPAGRDGDQGQQHRRELRRRGRAVPDARRRTWRTTGRGRSAAPTFTLKTLRVTQQFPKGWKAMIKCSGKKCPFKSKTLKAAKVKKQASSVISSLSKQAARFRAGQTIEIWVQRAELQHEGRADHAQEGQAAGDRAVLRAARIVEGPKDLLVMRF